MSCRLVVENLACGRGERALFPPVDLTLHAGETARVLGDNGIGKTTFLRTLAGLTHPLGGQVHWQDDNSAEVPRLVDALCWIDHDNALSGVLTPLENLRLLSQLAGRGVSDEDIGQTLARLGLGRLVHRVCGRLSSGQKRRVSLARLWLTDAPLWLLDEPAAALDADSRQILAAQIRAHAAAGGIVVFTTHEALDVPDARQIDLVASC